MSSEKEDENNIEENIPQENIENNNEEKNEHNPEEKIENQEDDEPKEVYVEDRGINTDELPPEEPRQKNQKDAFDLDSWLSRYGIRVKTEKAWKGGTKYVLEECPFDSSHKAPDSTIIKMTSGAICFKCLHNSCAGRDWKETYREELCCIRSIGTRRTISLY